MRRIILTFLFLLAYLLTISSTNAIEVKKVSSRTSNCSGANESVIYYIPNDKNSIEDGVMDFFWSNKDVYISSKSKVSIWTSDSSILQGCTNKSDWGRYSEVAPGKNIEVAAIGANCTYKKPTNKNKRTIQMVFNVKYASIGTTGTKTYTKKYTVFKNGKYERKTKDYKKYMVLKPYKYHSNECLNIELRYCGDGIKSNGEQCDDGNNIDGDGCSSICKVEPKPECSGLNIPEPLEVNAPATKTLTCTAKNVTKITIDCGNGTTNTKTYSSKQASASHSYTCNYTTKGTYHPICKVDQNITSNSCKGTLKVKNPTFDLALTKEVTSNGPYKIGDIVTYKIVVYNQGGIDAKNVEVTDYIPSKMEYVSTPGWTLENGKLVNKTITSLPAGDTHSLTLKLKIKDTAESGENIKNWAEISKAENDQGVDDCDSNPDNNPNNDTESQDYDEAHPNPTGCHKNSGDEDDIDPAVIKIATFDLAITKEITSEAPYNIGDIVDYKIIVYNQGEIEAKNIEVTDYVPSKMEYVSTPGWTLENGKLVNKTITSLSAGAKKSLNLKLKIKSTAHNGDKIKNWAEISKAEGGKDCDSTPDNTFGNDTESQDYNENHPNPTGCHKNSGDEDDIDPAELEVGGTFDLALRKTTVTSGPYNIGDTIEYKIEIINQGTLEGKNIEVTDYIPSNMEYVASTGWSIPVNGKTVNKTITSIKPGDTKELYIKLKIKSGVANGTKITNYAEISEDHAKDCDSTADDTNKNTAGEKDDKLIDNDIGNGCNTGGDEDDHDKEDIFVGAVCNAGVTGEQNSSISENTTNLCKNSGETVINFVSNTNGNTTVYTWACKDSNNVIYTGGNCSAYYTSGGGGHGGSSATCLDIQKGTETDTYIKYKCFGDDDTKVFGIDCNGDGIYEQSVFSENRSKFNKVNNIYTYTFTCQKEDANGNLIINNPRCAVEKHYIAANQSSGWNTSESCKIQTPYCGNGKIEGNEECEKTDTNHDGKINSQDSWPAHCNNNCTIKHSSNGGGYFGTLPIHDGNLKTLPSQGEIGFVGIYDMIIGHGQNLGTKLNNEIYIWNNSPYVFNNSIFNGICLTTANVINSDGTENYVNHGDSLTNLSQENPDKVYCTDIKTNFYPGQKIYLRKDLSNIKANKYKVDGQDYEDNKLVVTIRTTKDMSPYSNILNWSSHLTGKFKVRVAKPAIRTTSGTSYNKNAGANTKNIAEKNIEIKNKKSGINNNDTGIGTKSSDANITNNEKVVNDTKNIENNSNNITTTNTTFKNYNGLDNVFIKKGDTKLSNIISKYNLKNITKPITFIIDGGNLTIDSDLIGIPQNIAFIVKNGGNIIINKDVKEIQGTYVVLNNGKINSDGNDTNNILNIKGSLYGDSSDLVDHRTNVEEKNGELSFGTIVSFGSSIFKKPAPMVTKFINEYLQSSKTAQ